MAVSPIGGVILVNQMTPAVTPVQGGQYTRFELQNIAAQAAANEKQKEVDELRPAEENQSIDPDREHNRQEADEESARAKKGKKAASKDEDDENVHILDIMV